MKRRRQKNKKIKNLINQELKYQNISKFYRSRGIKIENLEIFDRSKMDQ